MKNILKEIDKSSLISFLGLCVLMIAISVNSYHTLQKKSGLFLDEVYTFYSTNRQVIQFDEFVDVLLNGDIQQYSKDIAEKEQSAVIDYDSFAKSMFVSDKGVFNYFNVYCAQSVDVHPPLYYFILHTFCSITRSSNIMMLGFSVNILFLIFSCLLLYKIAKRVTNVTWISFAAVAYYGFSYVFLFNVTYFRMYCVLTFEFLLLTLLYIRLCDRNWNATTKQIWVICVVEFLTMFTQYFSLLFILPLFLFSLYKLKYDSNLQKKFIRFHVISSIVYIIIWPQIFLHVISGFVQKSDSGTPLFPKLLGFAGEIYKSFWGGCAVWAIAFVLMLCISVFLRRKEISFETIQKNILKNDICLVSFLPAITYLVVTVIVSPWPAVRYISPSMPLVSLFIILVAVFVVKSLCNQKYMLALAVFSLVVINSVAWERKYPIKHLYENSGRKDFIDQYKMLNAIVVDYDNDVVYLEVPANYPHPYYFRSIESRMKSLLPPLLVDDKYILYVSRYCDEKNVVDILKEKNYVCEKVEYITDFFDVYLVEKVSAVLN